MGIYGLGYGRSTDAVDDVLAGPFMDKIFRLSYRAQARLALYPLMVGARECRLSIP